MVIKSALVHRKIVLGVTGSIAAYKALELVRLLRERGAEVQVVMTVAAHQFVTPLSFQALSGLPVRSDAFDLAAEAAMSHIELARWADLILIAPTSADRLAKLTQGCSDDLLGSICLASQAPLYIAPAMNRLMWENSATQANVTILKQRGLRFLGPAEGSQACGEFGFGRFLEPQDILAQLEQQISRQTILQQYHVVITAGPTQESLDPVRYLSNHSSGKMGYALAQVAQEMGARVTLISGPVELTAPFGVELKCVKSAEQMLQAVMSVISDCNIFIGAAAVSDYRPLQYSAQKLKKLAERVEITLVKNPDIIATVAALPSKQRPFTVGFAAETENGIAHGLAKLHDKKLDLVAMNDVSTPDHGFHSDFNALTLLWRGGQIVELEHGIKYDLAGRLLEQIAACYQPC